MKGRTAFLIMGFLGLATVGRAENRFSGIMFGDYYYINSNHDPSLEGDNAFWLRKIYFTYENLFQENAKIKLKLDMKSPGDFKTEGNLDTRVKEAYLEWRFGKHAFSIGLPPTPTWENIEDAWGYRLLEKTPLDLQDYGISEDIGLSLRGPLDQAGMWNYWVMVGNGNGNESETDKGKKIMASLSWTPRKPYYFEVYTDTEKKDTDTRILTYQAFGSYDMESYRVGVQYDYQAVEKGTAKNDFRIASIYFIRSFGPTWELITRYDKNFDANPGGAGILYLPFDPTAPSNFILLGMNYKAAKNVYFIPNIEYIFYDSLHGHRPDPDLFLRLTFVYKWRE